MRRLKATLALRQWVGARFARGKGSDANTVWDRIKDKYGHLPYEEQEYIFQHYIK